MENNSKEKKFLLSNKQQEAKEVEKKINFLIHLSPFLFLNLIFCHNKTLMFEVNLKMLPNAIKSIQFLFCSACNPLCMEGFTFI